MEVRTDGAYRAGTCNIGAEEIAHRRRSARLFFAASAVIAIAMVAARVPPIARALLFLPLAAGIVTELEVRRGFCVAYGTLGFRNFGSRGNAQRVEDEAARAADRIASLRMVFEGAAVAAATTGAFVVLGRFVR